MSIATRIESIEEHIEQAYDELQGLGADLTNVNKNIENISMVLDDIYDSMPQVSGEGTNLTLDDTRVGKIKSTLKGNTSQSGTPTPTSPIPINVVSGDNEIEVCGKNLLPNNQTAQTINGITFTINSDKSVSLSGTATSITDLYFVGTYNSYGTLPLETGTYNLNGCSGGDNSTYMLYCVGNRNGNLYYYQSINDSGRNIIIEKGDTFRFFIRVMNGVSVNTTIYPQLEKGSSASTYEPYQGNTYNIDLPVENLFDKDNANYVNGWVDGTTMRLNTINGNRMFYIPCKPNTTYTISRSVITSSFRTTTYDSTPFPTVTGSNVDYTVGSVLKNDNGKTLTITTGANAKYLVVHYGKIEDTNLNETLASIQVEYGSKQNSFTPYGTTPMELCKIGNYQDYFYKDSGKWYLHKEIGKVVLNGSEDWTKTSDTSASVFVTAILGRNTSLSSSSLSNYFKYQFANVEGKFYFGSSSSNNCAFCMATTYTLESFKTWLSTNNPFVYYVLATPTNTKITYEPLLEQLEAYYHAKSRATQTNISQENNDLPFIISASALKEWSV